MGTLSSPTPSFGPLPRVPNTYERWVDERSWRAGKTDTRTFAFNQGGGNVTLSVTWDAAGNGVSSYSANPALSTFTAAQQAELTGALATMGAPVAGMSGTYSAL